jgi:hypothetical protein
LPVIGRLSRHVLKRNDLSSTGRPRLSMTFAQTLGVCCDGKPVATFFRSTAIDATGE